LPLHTHPYTSVHPSVHRYENFLLSEGERVWYWRSRTENERWFWEAFAWDRLLAPTLFYVAWELAVPNNLLWAVVAPLSMIFWHSGTFPGPLNPEFWIIGYLGLYCKCGPTLAWAAAALFKWW